MSDAPTLVPKRPLRDARPVSSLVAHVRTPVHRDGYALVLNSAVTAVIGLAYWMVAARAYSAEVVGVNSAAISSMMFIAGISQLNFSNVLLRFVPDAGRAVQRLVVIAYATSLAVAGVAAALFVVGARRWGEGLELLVSTRGFGVWFVAATMVWCLFVLQDSVLTALGRAVWVPVENAVFSGVKLVLLVGLATTAPVYGIFGSWTAAVLASVIPVNLFIFLRLLPRAMTSAVRETISVTRPQLLRYMVADYIGAVSWLAATTLPPIIVSEAAGASATAYFSLGWVIALPLYFIPASVGSSLLVHAVRDPERLREYARAAFVQACRILIPAAAALVFAGPFLLRLLGDEYAEESVKVLRLVALAAIPNVVNVLYISVARVERRMNRVVAALTSQCVLTLGLALPLLRLYGITGVGIAWLIGQLAVALAIVAVERPALRRGSGAMRRALAALPADGHASPPASWAVQRRLVRDREMTVVAVGPAAGGPAAILKVADSELAAASLYREHAVLRELHASAALGAWRRLVPEPLALARIDSRTYLALGMLAGTDARRLVRDRGAERLTRTAAETIAVLVHRSAERTVVGDEQLARWVGGPAAVIAANARVAAQPRLAAALRRLEDELRRELAGRALATGWGHGDYWLGNVLVAADGREATGIVDWERAARDDLAILDTAHLLVTTRVLQGRRELGSVVRELVRGGAWTAYEQRLLDVLCEELGDDRLAPGQLALLVWLRHAANNLSKRAGFAGHRLWLRNNVVAVLDAFAP